MNLPKFLVSSVTLIQSFASTPTFVAARGGIPLNIDLPSCSRLHHPPPILLSPPPESGAVSGVSERRIDPVHLVKPNRSLSGLISGGFWFEAVNGTHAGAVTGCTDS